MLPFPALKVLRDFLPLSSVCCWQGAAQVPSTLLSGPCCWFAEEEIKRESAEVSEVLPCQEERCSHEVLCIVPQTKFLGPLSTNMYLVPWVYPKEKNLQVGRAALGGNPLYPWWIHLEAWHCSPDFFAVCSSLGLCVSETIHQTGNFKRGIKRCTQDFGGYQASIKICTTKWFPMTSPSLFRAAV